MRQAIEEFGHMSGLKPNLQKSNMFMAAVSEELKATYE